MMNNTEFKKAEIEMMIDGMYGLVVKAIMRSENYEKRLEELDEGSDLHNSVKSWMENEEAEIKKHYALIEKLRGAWFEAKE